jgi:CDP-diacylglycerol---glycerol-3-phosphate 3-phosphatidyltransferase
MTGSVTKTKPDQPSPYNLPNAITVVRILMVPVFVWLVLKNPNPNSMQAWWATGVFVLANVTDGLDGAIARSRGLVTNLGKILDPIADKALIGAGLILLSMLNVVPWIATILILVRELGITVYRLVVVRKRVLAASGGGKLKTILQAVTISFMISPLDSWWAPIGVLEQILLWISVALTLYSGGQYVLAAIRAPRV